MRAGIAEPGGSYDRTMDNRRGTVFVGDAPPGPWPRYTGYWDAADYWERDKTPPACLEDGPGWDVVEEAIKWGRERATIVLVRLRNTHYTAGDEVARDEEDQPLPQWSPERRP